MPKLKGILFDMDGVLVDSEDIILQAAIQMFEERGLTVQPEDFKPFTGTGENRYLGGVAEKYNFTLDIEKDKARTYEIYGFLAKNKLKPLPGVHDFVQLCKSRNLKLAVATSADRVKMEINLEAIGLPDNSFDVLVHGEMVENKKPYPDIYLKASALLGLDPASCLVIEDAVSGIEAGKSAGCKCLALLTSFPEEALGRADFIAKNLSAVPEEAINW